MTKKHLARLATPDTWSIKRKINKWITRPNPGPHSLDKGIPLNLVLRDLLSYTKTTRESKNVLNKGEVLVDKRIRKDYKFPVGLMDVVEFPRINKLFRVIFNKKRKISLIPINENDAKIKPCKIINKTILRNKKIQLNLYDGKNIIVDKNNYKVGDTLLLDLNKNQVSDHLPLKENSVVYLIKGKYLGSIGKIKSINEKDRSKTSFSIIIGKDVLNVDKDYIFVIGKEKPVIKLE